MHVARKIAARAAAAGSIGPLGGGGFVDPSGVGLTGPSVVVPSDAASGVTGVVSGSSPHARTRRMIDPSPNPTAIQARMPPILRLPFRPTSEMTSGDEDSSPRALRSLRHCL